MSAAKVGLTGGIGSGKSTVAKLFSEQGVPVISADQIALELSSPGHKEFDDIVDYFGSTIVLSTGQLDRRKLAQLVFHDSEKKKTLECILHPAIRLLMHNRVTASKADYGILEIPLLFETKQYMEMDRVLVVTTRNELRIDRLTQSRNLTEEEILARIKNQVDDKARRSIAHDIIENNHSEIELAHAVHALHIQYSMMFG